MSSAFILVPCSMLHKPKCMTVGDKQLVRTVSWYDNEMSYVSQLVRTVNYFARPDQQINYFIT